MELGLVALTAAIGMLACTSATAGFLPPGPNVALHRPYTLSPAPNYQYCTDPDDRVQLTDGVYTQDHFWTQKTTVGWNGVKPAEIVIDLGAVTPIAGLSFNTAAGVAGVEWPVGIAILVSDDGKDWWPVDDLVSLDLAHGAPPANGYAVHRFVTDALRCHGRYVALQVTPSGSFVFCDEVEVYRGPDALLTAPRTGEPVRDRLAHYRAELATMAARRATLRDARQVRVLLDAAHIDGTERSRLAALLGRAESDAARQRPSPGVRPVLPLGPAHQAIMAVRAELWRAEGQPTRVWQTNPYDPLQPGDMPGASAVGPTIGLTMLRNEIRGACLNVTNTGDRTLQVTVRMRGLPGGAAPAWLEVRQAAWTLTATGTAVASALPPARRTGGGWTIDAPVGMASQIWFRVHSAALPAGSHTGLALIEGSGKVLARVPVRLRVSRIRMPDRLSLSLGGWDYTDGPGRDVTDRSLPATVAFLRQYHVDAPWATGAAMPFGQHDADGAMVAPPDTTRMDRWLARWRGARMYMVFVSVNGPVSDTPAERRRVREWIAFWANHIAGQGVPPSRLALLLVDEPSTPGDEQTIAAYARSIHAAAPGVTVFEDPVFEDPAKMSQGLLDASDILCPNRPLWLTNRPAFEKVYLAQREAGKLLAFYSCSGPVRSMDPYSYHRLQAWDCFRYGMMHEGFWAFSDAGGGSAWDEPSAQGTCYTPQFLGPNGCETSKHMEAILEGLYDHETLTLLQKAVDERRKDRRAAAAAHAAESLLVDGPRKVTLAAGADDIRWSAPKDRGMADRVRAQAITLLEQLTPARRDHRKPAAR